LGSVGLFLFNDLFDAARADKASSRRAEAKQEDFRGWCIAARCLSKSFGGWPRRYFGVRNVHRSRQQRIEAALRTAKPRP